MSLEQRSAVPLGLTALPLLVMPLFAHAFQELEVGASVVVGDQWRSIYFTGGVTDVEVELGLQPLRFRYNLRCLTEARATRRPVHGVHGGFHDLFVPILQAGDVKATLVVGPFFITRPTSAELLERWLEMTGKQGRLTNPEFSRYVAGVLGTLTLDDGSFSVFERMIRCLAHAVSARDPSRWTGEAELLRQKLIGARAPERMWSIAQNMVDDRTAHTWLTGLQRDPLAELGMQRPAKHALVGLLVGSSAGNSARDPLADALNRAAFQRACTTFAKKRGHVVSGRVGDRGITFLPDFAEIGARARAASTDLGQAAAQLARRHELRLHLGVALSEKAGTLPLRYRAALAAAEEALSRGTSIQFAGPDTDVPAQTLRELRSALGLGVEKSPNHLSPRFERYLEAVLAQTGYRPETAREHLQAGLERLTEPLFSTGALDSKSFEEICQSVQGPRAPDSISELLLAYRRIVLDLERAVEKPTPARQERSTRRALSFVHEHLSEPLTLDQVAHVAGFAPDYFSKLLKDEEGLGFEQYLQRTRVERAKQLLSGTSLSAGRVAQLCGFRSRTYFQRLFKREVGQTPKEFRRIEWGTG